MTGKQRAASSTALAGVVLSLAFSVGSSSPLHADSHADASGPPGRIEFVGHNLFGDANGVFHRWRVVESRVDPANLSNSEARIEIDIASLDTGIGRRDDHLRTSDFFGVETWPIASARVHSARAIGASEAGKQRYAVSVDLDLHGVKKTLDAEITLESDSPLIFTGSLTLDRTGFGVGAAPGWNPMSPKAEVPVKFRIEL